LDGHTPSHALLWTVELAEKMITDGLQRLRHGRLLQSFLEESPFFIVPPSCDRSDNLMLAGEQIIDSSGA
jgi:hypothetical protein